MSYLQLTIYCEYQDIEQLAGELLEFGSTGVYEKLDGFDAYFSTEDFLKKDIIIHLSKINEGKIIDYTFIDIEDTNWNKLWESNYQPIEVNDFCYIYAPFHEQKEGFKHRVRIHPKMAFGTGHHETTHMMIEALASLDCTNKSVLDLGCGTGILAIVAKLEGAKDVLAVDIDSIAVEGLAENFEANEVDCSFQQGTIADINDQFDLLLANINRNVLIDDAEQIAQSVKKNGSLVLSGFYKEDAEKIEKQYRLHGFNATHRFEKNNWNCIIFENH